MSEINEQIKELAKERNTLDESIRTLKVCAKQLNNNIHDLRIELGDILYDLVEWMQQTSLAPMEDEKDNFNYIFQQVKSIKSFTNELKNYELVKKN